MHDAHRREKSGNGEPLPATGWPTPLTAACSRVPSGRERQRDRREGPACRLSLAPTRRAEDACASPSPAVSTVGGKPSALWPARRSRKGSPANSEKITLRRVCSGPGTRPVGMAQGCIACRPSRAGTTAARRRYVVGCSACSSCWLSPGIWNTSGRANFKNIRRAFGMPTSRHCETACGVTSHSSATALVPPRASMILLASMRH